ncbi:hypothetical protein DRO55_03260 [Candidatus Bathyarchaeota archaeon]|nr:MAG: hypothetical protein DRO55_03260 [Candidatus Bathyarchaeota archaeon]
MVKFKFNIFYVISIICILLLIGYFWFNFLPSFEGTLQYEEVRNVIILITIFLSIAIVLVLLSTMVRE